MSKIERALRKAEEEKRRRESVEDASAGDTSAGAATEGLNDDVVREGVFVADLAPKPKEAAEDAETPYGDERTSEHFRKIAAKLKAYYDSVGPTDIVFTSAVSGEGKTTSVINCAVSLCRDYNLTVCLVDCDLRKPKLSSHFELNGSPGIIEALKGEAELDAVVRPTAIKGLSIVHSRGAERQPLPLLNSERFRRFVSDLRARFDFVIFDSSPVLPVADTAVLAKHVSGVVLVIESGKTRKKHIEQVFEQMDRDKVIGFVMNFKKSRMPKTYNYTKYYNYGAK